MITFIKDVKTNKIMFFKDGKQIFDFSIKGNIVTFSNGEVIII